MAFNRVKFNYSSGVCDFVADSVSDLKYLPKNCVMGSSCYVINTSDKYYIDSFGNWKAQAKTSTTSSGAIFQNEIVNELPETGEAGILYLVPNEDNEDNNMYTEYLYINGKWEQMGTVNSNLIPMSADQIDAYFQGGN